MATKFLRQIILEEIKKVLKEGLGSEGPQNLDSDFNPKPIPDDLVQILSKDSRFKRLDADQQQAAIRQLQVNQGNIEDAIKYGMELGRIGKPGYKDQKSATQMDPSTAYGISTATGKVSALNTDFSKQYAKFAPQVQKLQRALAKVGATEKVNGKIVPLRADGKFGSATTAAVLKAFPKLKLDNVADLDVYHFQNAIDLIGQNSQMYANRFAGKQMDTAAPQSPTQEPESKTPEPDRKKLKKLPEKFKDTPVGAFYDEEGNPVQLFPESVLRKEIAKLLNKI